MERRYFRLVIDEYVKSRPVEAPGPLRISRARPGKPASWAAGATRDEPSRPLTPPSLVLQQYFDSACPDIVAAHPASKPNMLGPEIALLL